MRGETRRKARRCIHRRSIAARIAAKTTGAATQGAGERPSPRAPRRTRPEVPCAACFAAASGAEPAKMRRVAQDCDPKTYMYMSSGRKDARIGHFSRASTVAAKQAARCQANQHSTGSTIAPTVTAYGKANQRSTIAVTRTTGGRCGGGRGSHRSRACAPRDRRRPCRQTCRNRR